MKRLVRGLGLAGLTFLVAAACTAMEDTGGDSETNWFRICDSDDDCASLSCLCGFCTRACESTASCGGGPESSRCVPTDRFAQCSAGPAAATGVCAAGCAPARDCAGGLACLDGMCQRRVVQDAGAVGDAEASPMQAADSSSPAEDSRPSGEPDSSIPLHDASRTGDADANPGSNADANPTSSTDSRPPIRTDAQVAASPAFSVLSGLTAEQILTAGVFLGSCVSDTSIASYVRYAYHGDIGWPGGDPAALVSCLAARKDGCAAIEACMPLVMDSDGPCDRTCEGGVHSSCDDEWHFKEDCGAMGLSCDPREGCFDPNAPLCDWDQFTPACESGAHTYCAGRVTRTPPCEDFGLVCGDTGEDNAGIQCHGSNGFGDSWGSGPGAPFIEGLGCRDNVLDACVNYGQVRLDCGAFGPGLECRRKVLTEAECENTEVVIPECSSPAREMLYCGLGNECLETQDISCQGSSVVVCSLGKIEVIDCTELGFEGCAEPWGCTPNRFTR